MIRPGRSGADLSADVPSNLLFQSWCGPGLAGLEPAATADDAGTELRRALTIAPDEAVAPFFTRSDLDQWAQDLAADLPSDGDRDRLAADLALLQAGRAGTVVTGQQPGFLGGPLLTLHKVATAVALARERTAGGRPTVPVFWCGDDDEDLAEALSPQAWDPLNRRLLAADGRPGGPSARPRVMVGPTSARRWCQGALAWLTSLGAVRPASLAADLAAIWERALAEDWSWSRLNRRVLLRIMQGHGLLVVRGTDAGLHAAAEPLYADMQARMPELTALVRGRGQELAARGWPAQLGDRSLARPIYAVAGDARRPLVAGEDPRRGRELRPGVMLRSPVQDWLLQPSAVIVGPAEAAYLRQLDPLYGALGIGRSPLVPRLFAWLLPADRSSEVIDRHNRDQGPSPALIAQLADGARDTAQKHLTELLEERLGLPTDRAKELAAGRARRWRKGVAAMMAQEAERLRHERRPRDPGWLFPAGERQERGLAAAAAAALWGEPLAAALIATAAAHLKRGATGEWREYLLDMPDPETEWRSGP